ncbi:hypothetical protein ACN28E_07975 [Archangium lansingense]|uniref:hypothetical protein n=1 Tax=Archangium lansingense TaxID=2995310 RepID=UPI003B79DC91
MQVLNVNLMVGALAGGNYPVTVSYTAQFSAVERFLAQNGLVFTEEVSLGGVDPGAVAILATLGNPANIPIPAGPGQIQVARNIMGQVPQAVLEEDPNNPPHDIIARIRVTPTPPGLPLGDTGRSNIEQVP